MFEIKVMMFIYLLFMFEAIKHGEGSLRMTEHFFVTDE
jgi:hypothetical protein